MGTQPSFQTRNVFITGATGYMGQRLSAELLHRGHKVSGLMRSGSKSRLAEGCEAVIGDALDGSTFRQGVTRADTYVHLVGVSHPSPAKAQQFRDIDLKSCEESLIVAQINGISHFVYVSVAHPAPVMRAYIEVRTHCERKIRESRLNATILRPWYVVGPGHYWPLVLKPFYFLAKQVPRWREGSQRLGLVTLQQMTDALVAAVESPATGIKILEVPAIRNIKLHAADYPSRG